MPAGGSCLLGSINLSAFVKNPFTKDCYFDFLEFAKAVHISVDALNEVLEEGLPLHPLQEQRDSVEKWRQIGLGIMGLADTLIKLGLVYGEPDSLEFLSSIGKVMIQSALQESNYLATIKGTYGGYDDRVLDSAFFLYNTHDQPQLVQDVRDYGLRNSQLLTCAPTGSIATMLGVSNGIEPLFAKSWMRKTESLHGKDVYYTERPKIIKELMKEKNIKDDDSLPNYVITAHEISPLKRIDVQSVLQKYIDASISSTINLNEDATIKDVERIYLKAWHSQLKGVTIYREGCKRAGILTTEKEEKEEPKQNGLKRGEIIKPNEKNSIGFKRKLMTGCGSLHCAIYFDVNTGELTEIYLSKGSTGGCHNFMIGLSRMISASARAGVSVPDIVDQLMSTGACPSYATRTATKKDTSKGSCCPMAVGYALKDMWEEFNGIGEEKPIVQAKEPKNIESIKVKCPECGEPLNFEGGCNICRSCGYTKCD